MERSGSTASGASCEALVQAGNAGAVSSATGFSSDLAGALCAIGDLGVSIHADKSCFAMTDLLIDATR